jgi:hypothetical protein
LLVVAPEAIEMVEKLAEYLAEVHATEKANAHYGDEEAGHPCSYCEAIAAAHDLVARSKQVVPE